MRAQTGMTLKTSEKVFHNLILYFLLPTLSIFYINHKSHRFYWYLNIHDCLSTWRNFMDFWFCMPTSNRSSRLIVFLYPHNPPKINNWCRLENQRIQIVLSSLNIARVCHLNILNAYHRFWWELLTQVTWVAIKISIEP